MTHTHYYEIFAESYFDLGLQKGQLFKKNLLDALTREEKSETWNNRIRMSKNFLEPAEKAFPHLVEELRGYAKGADVGFEHLWALSLEDELSEIDKCTTIITNNGKIIAHNEDWEVDAQDNICILKKNVHNTTTLELFYYNTLGGNAISLNSHGYIQSINTLTHTDKKIGIPRTIVGRWLSETQSPEQDFVHFSKLERSSGYNHNFISRIGQVYNIESSASNHRVSNIIPPFVHTNHSLSTLKELENSNHIHGAYNLHGGTIDRYTYASEYTKEYMSLDDIIKLMSSTSNGVNNSIFNERTIARMIIDIDNRFAYIWLLRESEKGWIKYNIDFFYQ